MHHSISYRACCSLSSQKGTQKGAGKGEKQAVQEKKKVIEQTYRSQDAVVLFLIEQPVLYVKPHVLLIEEE